MLKENHGQFKLNSKKDNDGGAVISVISWSLSWSGWAFTTFINYSEKSKDSNYSPESEQLLPFHIAQEYTWDHFFKFG